MRQRSKAEWREGGGRVVFLALPSLGLYNGTPEMLAFHRYLLCLSPDQAALHRHSASSQRPYPWGQTPHPSLLPVPFPVGLILTLAQGKSTESPREGQHQHGADSFSELCPPRRAGGKAPGAACLTKGSRGPALPHQLHGWGETSFGQAVAAHLVQRTDGPASSGCGCQSLTLAHLCSSAPVSGDCLSIRRV